MEKKIMLAVDDSTHSQYAIRYAIRLASLLDQLSIVLYHTQPAVSQYLRDDARADMRRQGELNRMLRKNEEAGQELLRGHQESLLEGGVAEERITLITHPRKLETAKDILNTAELGLYDAILMGRRGISGVQEVFLGSVSNNVVRNSQTIPVWLVGSNVTTQHVLLAVDGSESALRAVEHVAFMLGGSQEPKITLFHVQPSLRDVCRIDFDDKDSDDLEQWVLDGDQRCLDRFFPLAMKKFSEFGLTEDRIRTKTIGGLTNIGGSIAKEVLDGLYDTVVMGRRGENRNFFTGRVSNYVLNKLTDNALWIVP